MGSIFKDSYDLERGNLIVVVLLSGREYKGHIVDILPDRFILKLAYSSKAVHFFKHGIESIHVKEEASE